MPQRAGRGSPKSDSRTPAARRRSELGAFQGALPTLPKKASTAERRQSPGLPPARAETEPVRRAPLKRTPRLDRAQPLTSSIAIAYIWPPPRKFPTLLLSGFA